MVQIMMNPRKLLKRALASPAGLRFAEMEALLRAFGFRLQRISGSHHIYARLGTAELMNLQEINGMAKPYQVRQFLKLIERLNINLE